MHLTRQTSYLIEHCLSSYRVGITTANPRRIEETILSLAHTYLAILIHWFLTGCDAQKVLQRKNSGVKAVAKYTNQSLKTGKHFDFSGAKVLFIPVEIMCVWNVIACGSCP